MSKKSVEKQLHMCSAVLACGNPPRTTNSGLVGIDLLSWCIKKVLNSSSTDIYICIYLGKCLSVSMTSKQICTWDYLNADN